MLNTSQTVEIIAVDTDIVEKAETSPEAYAFYIKLSDEPDNVWRSYLAKWDNALKVSQRKVEVVGDRLRLVFIYGDNVQRYAQYVAQIVKWINERITEYNKKREALEKIALGQQQQSRSKEEEIRQQLRQLKSEPTPAAMEVTAKELASAYETDMEKADTSFKNKIIKVTGIVNRMELKDKLDIHYITLGVEEDLQVSVRCMFDKGHVNELRRLGRGQMVTVQGEFVGSMWDLRMIHCVLV